MSIVALSLAATALSDGRGDGVEAAWSRDGAIAATTSCAEHFRRIGPNGLKIETDHPLPSFLETTRLNEVKGRRDTHRLDDLRDFINKRNGARDVVEHFDVPHLLPGHR